MRVVGQPKSEYVRQQHDGESSGVANWSAVIC
jgi:hypothetical protein